MDNEFSKFAPELYDTISIYVMFLIKQLYRFLPSPNQMVTALDQRFHLIENFNLGDVSRTNSLRPNGEMTMGTRPIHLLRILYYIILGFHCMCFLLLCDEHWIEWLFSVCRFYLIALGRHEENRTIIAHINPLFWNLLYALPFIYPDFSILHAYFAVLMLNHSVLRDYHALFIFNRIDDVLIVCFMNYELWIMNYELLSM